MTTKARYRVDINAKKKTVTYWKETTKEEYLKSLSIPKDLKKDINILISKCRNIP